jgi:2-iminobutanoate/2-iminopropanoate deaminase
VALMGNELESGEGTIMATTVVATDKAPGAIGPYSQAIKLNNLVFTAGQIPLDPATGKLIEGDIAAQTERVMQNLQAVLEAAGSSLGQVVKTTCFLANMDEFAAFNEVYARYFSENRPARSTVQAARLPAGASVEVECIAECS